MFDFREFKVQRLGDANVAQLEERVIAVLSGVGR
jgi:hypothetical protein